MTQEEKELLIKELCTRLPYHVFVQVSGKIFYGTELAPYQQPLTYGLIEKLGDLTIKPYLRPMSSMTEEDMDKLNQYVGGDRFIFKNGVISVDENFYQEGHLYSDHEDYVDIIDWLNCHHFDYRGLIEKGLALEAPEGMYK